MTWGGGGGGGGDGGSGGDLNFDSNEVTPNEVILKDVHLALLDNAFAGRQGEPCSGVCCHTADEQTARSIKRMGLAT